VGDYSFSYNGYLQQGGSDISHRVGARGVYKWRDEHNLHFGYGVDISKTRDGEKNLIHNIDIGDDFFSSFKINLDPTLTILASTGIGFTTGAGGARIANRINLSVTKLWQTASLTLGVNKGITPSFGVAGISDTTSFVADFNVRLTELLTAFVKSDFSLYDTKDVNFKTFVGAAGLQYRILSWLTSELRYAHRLRDAGSGANSTNLGANFTNLEGGTINSNIISLAFTANFDIWPNSGFARGPVSP